MNKSLEKQWFDFFASGFYGEAWDFRKNFQTEEEIEGVLNLLQPKPGSHFLDWCGGEGRHSLILAQKGFEVTLLDWAPNHIEEAKRKSKEAGVKINFICTDFRETPSSIQADYAINMFTAGIGYFEEEDDSKALKSLHAALKKDALFLLDTLNLFWLVRHYQKRAGYMSPDRRERIIEEREFDLWTNRNKSRTLYWNRGREEEKTFNQHIYSPAELIKLLKSSGFEPLELYGEFDGRPLSFDTERMIVVSRRK